MRKKQFAELGKQLLDDLPHFVVDGSLVYALPYGHVLRGLCFESSGFDRDAFYINAFAMPLYVPHENLAFTVCQRLRAEGNRQGWNAHSSNLVADLRSSVQDQAWVFLAKTASLDKFVDTLVSNKSLNPHQTAARAFGLVLLGRSKQAVSSIDDLLSQLDLNVVWQKTISDQAHTIKNLLNDSERKAQNQLELWEHETINNLHLSASDRGTVEVS